jgi:ribosomal protein L28
MKESSFYPYVEEFLKSEAFACFKTAQRVGTSFIGIADVVGVRDIGGDVRGDVEVIAVEVKMSPSNFGKILGQALGYSLFGHKCYLAIPFSDIEAFSLEQKELATRLGVGLMEIRKSHGVWHCSEALSSANHTPHGHQMETLLRRGLGLVRCSICGIFVDHSNVSESWGEALKKNKTYRVWRKPDRKLLFSRRKKGDWRRLYICADCVKELWEELALEE